MWMQRWNISVLAQASGCARRTTADLVQIGPSTSACPPSRSRAPRTRPALHSGTGTGATPSTVLRVAPDRAAQAGILPSALVPRRRAFPIRPWPIPRLSWYLSRSQVIPPSSSLPSIVTLLPLSISHFHPLICMSQSRTAGSHFAPEFRHSNCAGTHTHVLLHPHHSTSTSNPRSSAALCPLTHRTRRVSPGFGSAVTLIT